MERGRVAEACQKFAESLALARRGGTLLNLAVCREKEGRYTAALPLLREARERALKDGRADRAALAEDHLEGVERRLSWLTVRLAPGAAVPGLVVRRDGEELPGESLGAREAVDPGPHTVTAAAPGRARFEATVTVGTAGDAQVVEIPGEAPALEPRGGGTSTAAALRRPVGWTITALGLTTLVVGSAFGVEAIRDVRESAPSCPMNVCTTVAAYQQNQQAHRAARIADIAIPTGLPVGAAGLYLLLQPGAHARTGSPRLAPAIAIGTSSVSLRGGW
jgi:hypothetical protein